MPWNYSGRSKGSPSRRWISTNLIIHHSSLYMYNPFQQFTFDHKTCFLSGVPLVSDDEEQYVFPAWLMQRYELENKPFKLLDESISTYKQLKLPCSAAVSAQTAQLEAMVSAAFEAGFEAVQALEDVQLFQWITRIVYGVVFNEIQVGIRQQVLSGEAMNFSQLLAHKFRNLHAMLQSLIRPVVFDGQQPFSIRVFPVNNPENTFSYRDEINTLVFSLRTHDFGIIACLQDNGASQTYHQEVLRMVENQRLHPIQFEELCARFFYSAYLFNRLPEYTIADTGTTVFVEPMPLHAISSKPVFDPWQAKTYGQVLENFWKPWGFTLFEIIRNPQHPLSFIHDQQGRFMPAETISLPLQ